MWLVPVKNFQMIYGARRDSGKTKIVDQGVDQSMHYDLFKELERDLRPK